MTDQAPQGVDPRVPNAARMYDYFLGGTDNFPADRELADMVLNVLPKAREGAQQNRLFLGRVVRYLVEQGIRQFIDLGSGLPARENVHEVAHRHAPESKVVYVDNDPAVCAHGRALLADPGRVLMLEADARAPERVLQDPRVRALIDFDRPVAVLMLFFLHLIPDSDDPRDFVRDYREALAPGSFLALTHIGADERAGRTIELYRSASASFNPGPGAEVESFFGDFELIPPGLDTAWPFAGPEDTMVLEEDPAKMGYAGIGRKPW
ncbi:SAM-dependent methyltransferase [Nonomuraea typhae]|uniref:SAM-dependent methyltransferase n=1 Tax=Nonomuraea typhae TaxID=2603600 RepID=A0ABW7Z338_9ACTN